MTEQKRVLVVDDNVDLAENLAEVLEMIGVEVALTHSAEHALETLESRAFDLVVTDVRMPGKSGLELIASLREAWPGVPVLLITAYAEDDQLESARRAGVLEVLTKPIDLARLEALCVRILAMRTPVLVVEDDDDLRPNLVEALMQLPDVVPFSAGCAEEARRINEAVGFRVAVVDLRLPGKDGKTFGEELHAREDRRLSVLYITGYSSELANLGGSDAVLEKPFDSEALLAFVAGAP